MRRDSRMLRDTKSAVLETKSRSKDTLKPKNAENRTKRPSTSQTSSAEVLNMLNTYKGRLEDLKRVKPLENATKWLAEYVAVTTSKGRITDANRKYAKFQQLYKSCVDALETNIQKIETNPHVVMADLLTIPTLPDWFKNKRGNHNTTSTHQGTSKITFIQKAPIVYLPTTRVYSKTEAENTLEELKTRLERVIQHKLMRNAKKVLMEYKSEHTSHRLNSRASQRFEDYKNEYDEFVNALKENIQKLEKNPFICVSDLRQVPPFPQPFKLGSNSGSREHKTSSREDKSPASRGMLAELRQQKILLAKIEKHKYLKNADKVLYEFYENNESTVDRAKALEQWRAYTLYYDSIIADLKANIQKIKTDPSTDMNDLVHLAHFPQPLKLGRPSASRGNKCQVSSGVAEELQRQRILLEKVEQHKLLRNADNVLKEFYDFNPSLEDHKMAFASWISYRERHDAFVNALKANIRKIEENPAIDVSNLHPIPPFPQPFKLGSKPISNGEQHMLKMADELQHLKNLLKRLEQLKPTENADKVLQRYLEGDSINTDEAHRLFLAYIRSYYEYVDALMENIQKIEKNPSIRLVDLSPIPEFSLSFELDDILVEKPAEASIPIESVSMAEELQKLKKRLANVEQQKLNENAGRVLDKYLKNTKSKKLHIEARQAYKDYINLTYMPFVRALKTNIGKIEKNPSIPIAELVPVPKHPQPLKLQPKSIVTKETHFVNDANSFAEMVKNAMSSKILKLEPNNATSSHNPAIEDYPFLI